LLGKLEINFEDLYLRGTILQITYVPLEICLK